MARVPVDVTRRTRPGPTVLAAPLFIFDRGTEDEVDVYDAETAGSVVTQPLSANGEGRFPDCWVAPGSYDLHDPNDATEPTQPWEAVAGIDNADIALLEARVNVKHSDYGATGDGTTDETTAFGLARDAAGVGGVVDVPLGTYILENFLASVASQRWELAPGAVLKLKDSAAVGRVISLTADYVQLESGVIDGNRANNTGQTGYGGAVLIRANHNRVRDMYVHDVKGYGIYGAPTGVGATVSDAAVENCLAVDCVNAGVFFDYANPTTPSSGIRIINCPTDNAAIPAADVLGAGCGVKGGIVTTTTANRARNILIAHCPVTARADATAEIGGLGVSYCNDGEILGGHTEGTDYGRTCPDCEDLVIVGGSTFGSALYGVEFPGFA